MTKKGKSKADQGVATYFLAKHSGLFRPGAETILANSPMTAKPKLTLPARKYYTGLGGPGGGSGSSAAGNIAPTGSVIISGTASQGQTLTASNTLSDPNGMGPVSYQWRRDGTVIVGATGSTYLLVAGDVGHTISVTGSYVDGLGTTESVTSSSTAIVIAGGGTTWNPADKNAAIVLSNGNLTADATGAGAYVAVRAVAGKSTGKYYFEGVYPSNLVGPNQIIGIGSASASLNQYLGNPQSCGLDGAGAISGNIGGGSDGVPVIGAVISVAVDVSGKLIWFRVNGGNWNGSAVNDPATGVGGRSFSSPVSLPVFPMWNGGFSQGIFTANFGATAFAYAVPSGFTAGWP